MFKFQPGNVNVCAVQYIAKFCWEQENEVMKESFSKHAEIFPASLIWTSIVILNNFAPVSIYKSLVYDLSIVMVCWLVLPTHPMDGAQCITPQNIRSMPENLGRMVAISTLLK